VIPGLIYWGVERLRLAGEVQRRDFMPHHALFHAENEDYGIVTSIGASF